VTAADPRRDDARAKVVVAMSGVDPQLVKAVREGTYVVDPHAVADAMIKRHEALRLAAMLEALERDGFTGLGPEEDSGPRADVA
jgi:hypothetical protein